MPITLLYDGTCGLCARSVQFILAREKPGRATIQFATLQGPTAAALLQGHPQLREVDSAIWVNDDTSPPTVLVRSNAVLAVLRYVGGVWGVVARISAIVPRFIRDAVYDMVARTRYGIFGRDQSCLLPTPEQRKRFLP